MPVCMVLCMQEGGNVFSVCTSLYVLCVVCVICMVCVLFHGMYVCVCVASRLHTLTII